MEPAKLHLFSHKPDPPTSLKHIRLHSPYHAFSALVFLCLLFLLLGCGNSDDKPTMAYLGGEILNPTTDHIVIKRNGKILDTVLLNDKNRFSYRIDSVETGLYLIHHKPETQNVYISPGDSILLRANTLAFDESLHFSGKGHTRNNLMAEMFLEDENTARLLLNFYRYTPERFGQIADSIKLERENLLARANKTHEFSEDFLKLSNDIIQYENRDLRERYTYLVQKYFKKYGRQIPADFHQYREDVDFNYMELQCSPGYKRFLENYLINYSLSWCATSGIDIKDCYNLTNVDNVNARLRKAGELVQIPSLRQFILKKIAVRGIVMADSREDIISILEVLQELNFSEDDLEEMKKLGTIQLAFLPGTSLTEVSVVNMEGELVKFENIIKKPTVIFLWSAYTEGHIEEHKRIKKLRKKYPEVDFIGINLDIGDEPAWRVAVRKNNYNINYEYQLGPSSVEKEFFNYYMDKLLFLNTSREVVKGDVVLTSPDFETHLLEFLNQ